MRRKNLGGIFAFSADDIEEEKPKDLVKEEREVKAPLPRVTGFC